MSEILDPNIARLKESMSAAIMNRDYALYSAIKFSDTMLNADIAHGDLGVSTHPRQAHELLRLDTPARRSRAYDEAQTRQNLQGGVLSSQLRSAVRDLLYAIERGDEHRELWAEGAARRHREEEKRLREVTGRRVIVYPPEMRRS